MVNLPRMLGVDISLSGSIAAQGRLLQYRRGVFLWNFTCKCNTRVRFRRGHENCPALGQHGQLSRFERHQKQEMKLQLGLLGTKFTDIDFLLNLGQVARVSTILAEIQKQLGQLYRDTKLAEEEQKSKTLTRFMDPILT